MIKPGSEITHKITNATHIVDGFEIINNEKLVFTTDMKCFPINEIRINEDTCTVESVIYELVKSKRKIDMGLLTPPPFTPQKLSKKNMFETIWSKITCGFTSSNG